MNDVQFSDTPLTTGILADYCERFPNSPACTHLSGSGSGQAHHQNGGNGGHHDHHDNHHGDSSGGNNGGHPLS